MQLFPFQDIETGELIDLPLTNKQRDMIELGEVAEIDGRLLKRLIPNLQAPCMGPKYPFKAYQYWSKDRAGINHQDEKGVPVMTGPQDVRDFCRANGKSYDWGVEGAK